MRRIAAWGLVLSVSCGGAPPPKTTPDVRSPPPAVAPSPGAPASARGTLSVGEAARAPADLPFPLDRLRLTLAVETPEGVFVHVAPAQGHEDEGDLVQRALAAAGCPAPARLAAPGQVTLTCPPDAARPGLAAVVPAHGDATILWRRPPAP